MPNGPNEGLHIDQVARHHAFFKQIRADITIQPQHRIVGFPVRFRLVIDAPAKQLGRKLNNAGFDVSTLLWMADKTKKRCKGPFIELQNTQRAKKMLKARLLCFRAIEQIGQCDREQFLARRLLKCFMERLALPFGQQVRSQFNVPGAITDRLKTTLLNKPGKLLLTQ